MKKEWAFDTEHYTRITEARLRFLNQWLPELVTSENLKSGLDVGCGGGYFSNYLDGLGIKVVAFDAREENIIEAQKRYPNIKCIIQNIEDPQVKQLGPFDLVFCLGLLYHLENPFLAVRNLHALTKKILLIESMIIPEVNPGGKLIDESFSEDQSVNYIAFVLSELGLIKLLYRSGFNFVYKSTFMPKHEDFCETYEYRQKRTMLVATIEPLKLSFLSPVSEPVLKNPWLKPLGHQKKRIHTFIRKPFREKIISGKFRINALLCRLFY